MKAVVHEKYGSPDVLELKTVKKPTPKEDELLVRIYATPVSYGDITARKFKYISPREFNMPFLFWLFARISFGLRKPKKQILGSEFAGEIELIGKDVTRFKRVTRYSGISLLALEHMPSMYVYLQMVSGNKTR